MATLLAAMPDLLNHAESVHVADTHGYCHECGTEVRWPCEVSQIAAEAALLADPAAEDVADVGTASPGASHTGLARRQPMDAWDTGEHAAGWVPVPRRAGGAVTAGTREERGEHA